MMATTEEINRQLNKFKEMLEIVDFKNNFPDLYFVVFPRDMKIRELIERVESIDKGPSAK